VEWGAFLAMAEAPLLPNPIKHFPRGSERRVKPKAFLL
jgi:hypothetical protein